MDKKRGDFLREMVNDSVDRRHVSHTKFWSSIAYAAATVIFVKTGWEGDLSTEIWLIYLGVVGAHSSISKFLSIQNGNSSSRPG